MKKEVSPAVTVITIIVVLLVLGVGGYFFLSRPKGQLTEEQQREADQTIEQQYRGYRPPAAGGPGAMPGTSSPPGR